MWHYLLRRLLILIPVLAGISLVLFFVPMVNGLIGGFVGGYRVGTPKRALLAALLPSVALAIGLWALFAVLGSPVLGFFSGAAVLITVVLSCASLFIGAAIGGFVGRGRATHSEPPAARPLRPRPRTPTDRDRPAV